MEVVMRAILESDFKVGQTQLTLPFDTEQEGIHREWENVSEREKRSRTLFAQETIKVDEIAQELRALREAIGRSQDVRWFVREAITAYGGTVDGDTVARIDPRELPPVVRDLMPSADPFEVRFELPVARGQVYWNRAHGAVAGLSSHVFESAIDPLGDRPIARRTGVIRTPAVARRTTLLITRMRFAIKTHRTEGPHESLAEELRLLAFEGAPESAAWLEPSAAEALLDAVPQGNVFPQQAEGFVRKVVEGYVTHLAPHLEEFARLQAQDLLEAHLRVRKASRAGGRKPLVEPFLPVDVLGIYMYLPAGA
jgi:hypothetical protein